MLLISDIVVIAVRYIWIN